MPRFPMINQSADREKAIKTLQETVNNLERALTKGKFPFMYEGTYMFKGTTQVRIKITKEEIARLKQL